MVITIKSPSGERTIELMPADIISISSLGPKSKVIDNMPYGMFEDILNTAHMHQVMIRERYEFNKQR